MTYDPASSYVVLYGGSSRADTWTFAEGRWTELSPSVFPSPRVWSNMVYDAKDGYVLLFGGQGSGSKKTSIQLHDTWTFSSGTWTNITSSAGNPPPFSYGSSMAYDSEAGYVVLFGGMHTGIFSNQTWTFSGGSWQNITSAAGTPPPCRFDASMSDDPAAGYVLLFGGQGHEPSGCGAAKKHPIVVFDDTWEFASGKWTPLSPVESPPALWMASMGYDPATASLTLFGGVAAANFAMAETWYYVVSAGVGDWVNGSLATYPPARFSAMFAFDGADGYFVLFGGLSETFVHAPLLSDTWTFHGTTWTNLTSSPLPSPRTSMALAYDPNADFVLLFGGRGSSGVLGDTWKFAGNSWLELTPPSPPPARSGAVLAYDAADGYLVLFGGVTTSGVLLNDTWAYESGKTEWVELSPVTAPPPRVNASLAYDAEDRYLLLFGGNGTDGPLADTWKFVDDQWTRLTPVASPSARSSAGTTYDPTVGGVVLFGGEGASGPLGDTWAYSAGDWEELNPGGSGAPAARYGAGLSYDPSSGDDLLFGGWGLTGLQPGVWSYSDGQWDPLSTSHTPTPRVEAGFTFDSIDSVLLWVGGANASGLGKTLNCWTYSSANWVPSVAERGRVRSGRSVPDAV